jgi:hydroxymethylglutaryl-CoA synthase
MAADWVRSGSARGRKALVIATDIARYDLGSSAEFTQGAGAAALLVGESPRFLELGDATGVFASNVYDFWRPLNRREALVDGKFSLDCYLNALEGALTDYRTNLNGDGARLLTDRFAAILYHTPFPKMAYKAHHRLVTHQLRAATHLSNDEITAVAEQSYRALVDPSLGAARVVGNTYTASLYLCLAWLAECAGRELESKEIGLFSYGSGCCAEFFSGRFVEGSAALASGIGLGALLDARRELSVAEYEAFVGTETAGGVPHDGEAPFCYLSEIRDHKRIYETSRQVC